MVIKSNSTTTIFFKFCTPPNRIKCVSKIPDASEDYWFERANNLKWLINLRQVASEGKIWLTVRKSSAVFGAPTGRPLQLQRHGGGYCPWLILILTLSLLTCARASVARFLSPHRSSWTMCAAQTYLSKNMSCNLYQLRLRSQLHSMSRKQDHIRDPSTLNDNLQGLWKRVPICERVSQPPSVLHTNPWVPYHSTPELSLTHIMASQLIRMWSVRRRRRLQCVLCNGNTQVRSSGLGLKHQLIPYLHSGRSCLREAIKRRARGW